MIKNNSTYNQNGFTLIEVVLVIIISGILLTVALKSVGQFAETSKVENTKTELEQIAIAVHGNPELESRGIRTDFGYIGDVGSMPPDLDALVSNPGSYSTWNGPYINSRFIQLTNDYKQDAWGTDYSFSGVELISTGSGSEIVKKLSNSTSDFIYNNVSGVLLDLNGTSPGPVYKDSVSVQLTIPDGSGSYITKATIPDNGGYFSFDSIPIGTHDINLIYTPDNDTLKRFTTVLPGANSYGEYLLANDVWYDTTAGGIILIPSSDTVFQNPQCNNFSFWIINNTIAPITINSLKLEWTSPPTAYFKEVLWNSIKVINEPNPKIASGDIFPFIAPQTLNAGQRAKITAKAFRSAVTGGSAVNMENISIIVTLSDGSTFIVPLGACI